MFFRNRFLVAVVIVFFFLLKMASAQDTIKMNTIHSIWDIPHKTAKQKWMWIHRSTAYIIVKERPTHSDTNYIKSYKKQLVVTLPLSTRFMRFELRDWATGNRLKYSPNSQYDLGISVNSKFASFLINTGATFFENDRGVKGKTDYRDYQFNFYGKARTTDVSLQVYRGFYVKNSGKYPAWDSSNVQPYSMRQDVQAVSFGYNMYYVLNYKKFSYRNSFAFTEQQLKSAGSPLFGGYWSLFTVTADSSLAGYYFGKSLSPTADIRNGIISNVGLNVGYIYTLVLKKRVYATVSLVQGLGMDKSTFVYADGTTSDRKVHFASKQQIRVALGFDNGRFFAGTMGMFDFYYFNSESDATIDYAMGKGRLYVGYRFPFEKIQNKTLRKLNLIDYRL